MKLDSIPDIKLASRALSTWLKEDDENRSKAVQALYDVVLTNADPEMKARAFEALLKADLVDIKRKEVQLKQQAIDDAKRLRLLELIKHVQPGTLAAIASGNAEVIDGGRAIEGQGPQSETEGI